LDPPNDLRGYAPHVEWLRHHDAIDKHLHANTIKELIARLIWELAVVMEESAPEGDVSTSDQDDAARIDSYVRNGKKELLRADRAPPLYLLFGHEDALLRSAPPLESG